MKLDPCSVNYIRMNFIAPFKIEGKTLHIAISDSSKLSLMRNLKTITKKEIELHAEKVTQISDYIQNYYQMKLQLKVFKKQIEKR